MLFSRKLSNVLCVLPPPPPLADLGQNLFINKSTTSGVIYTRSPFYYMGKSLIGIFHSAVKWRNYRLKFEQNLVHFSHPVIQISAYGVGELSLLMK